MSRQTQNDARLQEISCDKIPTIGVIAISLCCDNFLVCVMIQWVLSLILWVMFNILRQIC